MPRFAKGKRPIFLENKQTDQLLSIVIALMGEVSVLRDRLDTLERLAEAKGLILRQEIETYEPDTHIIEEQERSRAEYVARILRILQEE
ncbi:hypothetical protein [Cylindrospermum sp. FACHB-282]|uniref:hypothetical protein n=1 Tax=Cylindrospermum sp. FACHB-282 TaxID=2692794 RepID=UPI0016829F68|nr:hypothetical protein [Cylindrospermum sp. FACHB-282]MBD2387047.1 hypothetical protein [Cylindrospermum sp. FACHB-282]